MRSAWGRPRAPGDPARSQQQAGPGVGDTLPRGGSCCRVRLQGHPAHDPAFRSAAPLRGLRLRSALSPFHPNPSSKWGDLGLAAHERQSLASAAPPPSQTHGLPRPGQLPLTQQCLAGKRLPHHLLPCGWTCCWEQNLLDLQPVKQGGSSAPWRGGGARRWWVKLAGR